MKGWNPFGKVDMEIGSFLRPSAFNKDYRQDHTARKDKKPDDKADDNKTVDDK
jgi:hypothetical protein